MVMKSVTARYKKRVAEWMGEGDNLLAGILCSSPPVRPLGDITFWSPLMRPITYQEIAATGCRLYSLLCGFEKSALKKARQRGSPYCWLSLKDMCFRLGVSNSGRNRTLMVRAKRYLKQHLKFVRFFSQFKPGKRLADLFCLLSAKEIGRAKHRDKYSKVNFPPVTGVKVLGVAVVLGYPKSWDEVTVTA
jgi:hypothetical protein